MDTNEFLNKLKSPEYQENLIIEGMKSKILEAIPSFPIEKIKITKDVVTGDFIVTGPAELKEQIKKIIK